MKALGLAEYGGDEMLIALLACGSAAYALALVHPALAVIPLIPLGIVVWFFRDPERSGTDDPEIMLSPADGRVSDIEEVDEPNFIRGKAKRIGIFLSPFNVHVNRTPCEGTVRHITYKAGEFLPAYNPEAPTRNECVSLGLELEGGLRVMVRQVTGILARRIICQTDYGAQLKRGQRYGMIKFGSRTELYVPIEQFAECLVKIGDNVVGGTTPLCKVNLTVPKAPHDQPEQMVFSGEAMLSGDVALAEKRLSAEAAAIEASDNH